jgi:hypothetical protein
METDRQETLWDVLSPCWMFYCRRADFRDWQPSICPGVFYLPGLAALLSLHVLSVWGCRLLWLAGGGVWAPLLSLLPLAVLWGWFVTADVKFRRQRPTRSERAGFDNAVVNWFGLAATLATYFVLLPAGLAAALLW